MSFQGQLKIELSKKLHKNFIKDEDSFIIELFYIKLIKNCLCPFDYTSYSFNKFLDLPLLIPSDEKQ